MEYVLICTSQFVLLLVWKQQVAERSSKRMISKYERLFKTNTQQALTPKLNGSICTNLGFKTKSEMTIP